MILGLALSSDLLSGLLFQKSGAEESAYFPLSFV